MNAACPRAFPFQLQVGACVTLDQKYGHRDLVQLLFNHEFCASYAESVLYKQNATVTHGVDIGELITDSLLHFIADNVDYSVKTLDEEDVINMMSQMGAISPVRSSKNNIPIVKVAM